MCDMSKVCFELNYLDVLSRLVVTQWRLLIWNYSYFTLLIFMYTCWYYTSQYISPCNQICEYIKVASSCESMGCEGQDFPWCCLEQFALIVPACRIGNVCIHAMQCVNHSLVCGWNYYLKKTLRNVMWVELKHHRGLHLALLLYSDQRS